MLFSGVHLIVSLCDEHVVEIRTKQKKPLGGSFERMER